MSFEAATAEPMVAQSEGFDPETATPLRAHNFDPSTAQLALAPKRPADQPAGETDEEYAFRKDLERSGTKTEGSFQQKALEPALAGAMAPSIKLPDVPKDLPEANIPGTPVPMNVAGGVAQGVKSGAEALTAPVMAVLGPLGQGGATGRIALKLVEAYFAGDMSAESGRKVAEMIDVVKDPNATKQDVARVTTELATNALFTGLVAGHMTKGGLTKPGVEAQPAGETILPGKMGEFTPQGPPAPKGIFDPETAEPLRAGEPPVAPPVPTTDVAPETAAREELNAKLAEEGRQADETKKQQWVADAIKDPKTTYQYSVWDRSAVPEGKSRVLQVDMLSPDAPDAQDNNHGSVSIDRLRKAGVDLPEPPEWMPSGRYTVDEVRRAIAEGPPKPGELLGAETPFNLAGEAGTEAPAPEEPTVTNFDLLPPEAGRSTAPTALDRANEAARASAPAEVSAFDNPADQPIAPVGKPLTVDERARMRAEEAGSQKPTGPEIQDVVRGQLPHPDSEIALKGELQGIWDNLVKERKVPEKKATVEDKRSRKAFTQKDTSEAMRFFRKKGGKSDLDSLRQKVNEAGFNFQTPADMLAAVENSQRGNKLYGQPVEQRQVTETGRPDAAPTPIEAKATRGARIVNVLRDRNDAAVARLKAKLSGGRASMGLDPTILKDLVDIATYHVARGLDWAAELVKEYGEETVKPYLAKIRAALAEQKPGEVPERAVEDDPNLYGISAKINAQRAAAGHIDPIESGQGIGVEESIQLGRQLLELGNDPQRAIDEFNRTNAVSSADIALVRARGEELAQEAYRALDEHGDNSPEYQAAKQADSEWQQQVKKMQTEWAKAGHAMQGATEVDTGNIHSMRRDFIDRAGRDFTPAEEREVKQVVEKVKQTRKEADAAEKKVFDEVARELEPSDEVKSLADRIAAQLDKSAQADYDWLRERMAKGPLFAGGIDPEVALHVVRYGAAKIAKGTINFGKWANEMRRELGDRIEPHLQDLWAKANALIDESVRKNVSGANRKAVTEVLKGPRDKPKLTRTPAMEKITPTAEEARRQAQLPGIEQPNIGPDNPLKTARDIKGTAEEQGRQAGIPGVERPAIMPDEATRKTGEVIGNAEEQGKQAALTGIEKPAVRPDVPTSRKGVVVGTPSEQAKQMRIDETQADPTSRDVWELAKQYIDEGGYSFDEIRQKIASDTGKSPEEIYRILAGPKNISRLTNDMYARLAERRRAVEAAKAFLANQAMPAWERVVSNVPRAFFKLYTFGHGTVGPITHAAVNVFDAKVSRIWVQNFFRGFRLLGLHDKGAYHERMMANMMADEHYITARRAGLANDPHRYTDDYQQAWLGKYFKRIGLSGNRGFDALKLMRQEMFNKFWNDFPDSIKTADNAKMLADSINHTTGVVKARLWQAANWTFFAPRLEGSRWAWMIGDPAKAVKIATEWKTASPAERAFAMREVRQKLTIAGTYVGLLALNQAFLSATGSPQKVNFNRPQDPDYLAFKVGGYRVGIIGPMLGTVRLLANLIHISTATRNKTERKGSRFEEGVLTAGKYVRNKLSPFAGVVTDVATQADYMKRPLPFSKDKVPAYLRRQGMDRYSYAEYASERLTPIPVSEAAREIWAKQGMNESQIAHVMKGLAAGAVMGSTGVRVSKDYSTDRQVRE